MLTPTEGFITLLVLFLVLPVSILLVRDLISLLMGKPRRFKFTLDHPSDAEIEELERAFYEHTNYSKEVRKYSSPGIVKFGAYLWTSFWCSGFLMVVIAFVMAVEEWSSGRTKTDDPVLLIASAVACGGAFVLAILVSLLIRCDKCGRHCFVIFSSTPGSYLYSEKMRREKLLPSVKRMLCFDVHKEKGFQCAYCHTNYSIAD